MVIKCISIFSINFFFFSTIYFWLLHFDNVFSSEEHYYELSRSYTRHFDIYIFIRHMYSRGCNMCSRVISITEGRRKKSFLYQYSQVNNITRKIFFQTFEFSILLCFSLSFSMLVVIDKDERKFQVTCVYNLHACTRSILSFEFMKNK